MNNKFRNNFLYLFFIFAFFNFINLSNALIISEIMYDTASDNKNDAEWIEVYNNESESVNLLDYKFDYSSDASFSPMPLINPDNASNTILEPNKYAVIIFMASSTVFKSDFPSYSGILMKVDGLNKTSSYLVASSYFTSAGKLILKKGDNIVFAAEYTKFSSASSSGLVRPTLNNIYNISTTRFCPSSGNINEPLWYPASASPGATTTYTGPFATNTDFNLTFDCITESNTGDSSQSQSPSEANASSYYTSGYYSRTYTIGDMRVIVPKDIYGIAGGETYFPSIIMNSKKEILKGDFLWSFGDGSSLATSTPKYIYKNPGEYIATIEAQQSGTSLYGIERVIVHIAAPDIIISDYVNEEKNIPFWRQDNKGYIELYNRSNEEVNIGGFYIEGGGGYYQLSKFFIIPAHSKVKIYNNILNLQTLDNPKLLFPNRLVLYDWNGNHNLITATTTPIYVLSNNNSKNSSTTDIILSTSTTIISTTTPTTIQGNIQSINKSINRITQNNIRPKAQSKTNDTNIDNINNVDKPSIPFYKKLLYFLYE